jgi:hypothetical protein
VAVSEYERQLIEDIGGFTHDPLGFVLYAFPWGEPGPLEEFQGPLEWQADLLRAIRDGLIDASQAIQIAVSSGHGIGKSAFVSMVICWAMSTCPNTRGVVTAGTEGQLSTKTQPEVAKWVRMMICAHWFECTATKMYAKDHPDSWRLDFVPWNESNPEAFAGLHNLGRRILVLIDEASQVARIIWETIRGALTDKDTEILFFAFGNPTRNSGEFFECFGKNKHRWTCRQIDSRTVPITNKDQIQQWVDDYGEDSDFVRIRVRGVFPRAGSNQIVSGAAVEAARLRQDAAQKSPFLIGVDIARFGDDQTVIALREGDRLHPLIKRRGLDLMQTAGLVSDLIVRHQPEAVFIDEVGVGSGVVDRLRQLGHKVFGINAGSTASERSTYSNLSAEMWARMASWLERTGCLPPDIELEQELVAREYRYDAQNRIQLEKKGDMKKRGLSSPDCADALAMTFAMMLPAADILDARRKRVQESRRSHDVLDSI